MSNSRLDKMLELLQSQPEDPFLLYAVGFEYESMGAIEQAFSYYNSLLKKHPTYLPVYYQAGLLHAGNGNAAAGIELLQKGIELAIEQKDQKTLRELRQALEEVEEDME